MNRRDDELEAYKTGLANLRQAILLKLVDAGARATADCVTCPKTSEWKSWPPASLPIRAVPFDGPAVEVKFTKDEVIGCSTSVERKGIQDKVNRYVAGYKQFRSGVGKVNSVPTLVGQSPISAKPWLK